MTDFALPARPRLIGAIFVAALALAACAPAEIEVGAGAPVETATPAATPAVTSSPAATAAASATPSQDADAGTDVDDADVAGGAEEAALALTVKGRAPKTGYSRDEFGDGWVDIDRNGCDTRNDMLQLRLTALEMSGTCKVLAGDLDDPFTGMQIHFERGGASEVDIDHLVALSDAWQKGAAQWEFAKRVAFANDPLNLEPVDASSNRQKGDADAATWLPSHKAFRCDYVARQIAVKTKYEVWVTRAEQHAMLRVLDACPGQELPDFGDQPVIADNVGRAPEPEETPAPEEATASSADPRFPYCKDAIAAGYGPYVKGQDEEYGWYRDGDSDGTVCER